MSGERFDVDQLVADLRGCLVEDDTRGAVRQVVSRALASRQAMADTFQPTEGRLNPLHRSDDLTVLELVWPPGMTLFPHDHRMWACIGIYTGREDNSFFRRAGEDKRHLVESGGKTLLDGDVTLLGDDTIHAVVNPLRSATGAIHVYGGDFFAQPRSQWIDPERVEEPYDVDLLARTFASANERWQDERAQGDGTDPVDR
jgi:predicted metal-dependent enzyme (double-stranded beta helix superfamily)